LLESCEMCAVTGHFGTNIKQYFLLVLNGNLLKPYQVSISSRFYSSVFCTKFWHQKLLSCVLSLRFFGAKISVQNVRIKCWWIWQHVFTVICYTIILFANSILKFKNDSTSVIIKITCCSYYILELIPVDFAVNAWSYQIR